MNWAAGLRLKTLCGIPPVRIRMEFIHFLAIIPRNNRPLQNLLKSAVEIVLTLLQYGHADDDHDDMGLKLGNSCLVCDFYLQIMLTVLIAVQCQGRPSAGGVE